MVQHNLPKNDFRHLQLSKLKCGRKNEAGMENTERHLLDLPNAGFSSVKSQGIFGFAKQSDKITQRQKLPKYM